MTNWQKLLSANSTSASFTARVPTLTQPTGTGVVAVPPGMTRVIVMPFGTDAANETGKLQLWGWSAVRSPSGGKVLWIPRPICELTATLGTAAGVAGSEVDENQLFADTLVADKGVGVDYDFLDNTTAMLSASLIEDALLEVQFSLNSSSASLNTLYSFKE